MSGPSKEGIREGPYLVVELEYEPRRVSEQMAVSMLRQRPTRVWELGRFLGQSV